MFKQIHWKPYLLYSSIAAIAYCIPVTFYLKRAVYESSWLLFLGNVFFMFVIVAFLFYFNRERRKNAGGVAMMAAGHITTVAGTILACLLSFILLWLFVPDLFQAGTPDKVLEGAPANTVDDKTSGLTFMLFADAILGNIFSGSFVSVLFPFAMKKDQTKEKVPRKQAEL